MGRGGAPPHASGGGRAGGGGYGFGGLCVSACFGLAAGRGSAHVPLQRSPCLSLLAPVPVGLLATALLVVNSLRDSPTDTVAGKRTLAVRVGDRATRGLYVT